MFKLDPILMPADAVLAMTFLNPEGIGGVVNVCRDPDLIIAPEGHPYIYRWHLVPRNRKANLYFHIQVADDPERPLHDHPWDNMSVILAGGYTEIIERNPPHGTQEVIQRRKGDVIFRQGEEAHRLLLPPQFTYAMTVFSTGNHRRKWGFWSMAKDGTQTWIDQARVIENRADGTSVYTGAKQ